MVLWAMWLHSNEVFFRGREASKDGVTSSMMSKVFYISLALKRDTSVHIEQIYVIYLVDHRLWVILLFFLHLLILLSSV